MQEVGSKYSTVALIVAEDRCRSDYNDIIKSVLSQTKLPDHLIIVNERGFEIPQKTREDISKIVDGKIELSLICNQRTNGISGVLNTGIVYTNELLSDDEDAYIFILNDGDEWMPNHVEECSKLIPKNDVVISGVKQLCGKKNFYKDIATETDVSEMLLNDILSGHSNLVLSLRKTLQAGMFDENLLCFNSKDLLLRFSELRAEVGHTRINTVRRHLDKLTCPLITEEKTNICEGVELFWEKHGPRMSSSTMKSGIEELMNPYRGGFTWDKHPPNISEMKPNMISTKPFHLVIGIINASNRQIIPLLKDIIEMKKQNCLDIVDTVILENGSDTQDPSEILFYLERISDDSILISKKQQGIDSTKGLFGKPFDRGNSQLPICKARTLLQKYLGSYVSKKPESIVWILDDDMRIHDKVYDYLPWIPVLRSSGIDVLLGRFEGSSPNPPANAIRVQTLDLFYNLERLDLHDDNEILPDLDHLNKKLRAKYPDYYYDLSRKHYGHLESPYWINKIREKETVGELRARVMKNILKILTGEPFFRPLITDLPEDPVKEVVDSANRGGSTFIFDHETLFNTPNPTMNISGEESRRTDMLWALINKYHYGCDIKLVNFPVYHNRIVDVIPDLDLYKTVKEIQGASIYAGLSDYLSSHNTDGFVFSEDQMDDIWEIVSSYLEKRITQYKINFERMKGLIIALKKYERYEPVNQYSNKVGEFFSDENLERLINASRKLDRSELESALHSVSKQIVEYSNSSIDMSFLDEM